MFGLGKKKKYTDIEYIQGIQSNDQEVINNFYNTCKEYFDTQYTGVVNTSMYRAKGTDDLFHDSFAKLWTEIESKKISIHDNQICRMDRNKQVRLMTAKLTTYFMAIVRNVNYENVREEAVYVDDLATGGAAGGKDVIDEKEDYTPEQIVAQCVCALPKRCKEILTAFYYFDKSLDQILEERQENQSKNGLKTAKAKCMKQLKDDIVVEFKRNNLKLYA